MDIAVTAQSEAQDTTRLRLEARSPASDPTFELFDVEQGVWSELAGAEAEVRDGDYLVVAHSGGRAPEERDGGGEPVAGTWARVRQGQVEQQAIQARVLRHWLRFDPTRAERPPACTVVAGSPRSGTTLLQSVLCSAPTTNPLTFEAVPFRVVSSAFRTIANHAKATGNAYFKSTEEVAEMFRDLVHTMEAKVRENYGAQHLVLKEPAMTHYLPEATRLLDDVHVFCVVRDPRDIVASMRTWGRKAEKRGELHEYALQPARVLARDIAENYQTVLSRQTQAQPLPLTFVRYESFVADPHAQAAHVARISGLDLSGYDPGERWQRSAIDFSDRKLHIADAVTDLYGQPVAGSSVGSYRDVLDAEEVKAIEYICRNLMITFGYRFDYGFDDAQAVIAQGTAGTGGHDEQAHERFERLHRRIKQLEKVEAENASLKSDNAALRQEVKTLRPKAKNWDELKPELPRLRYRDKHYDDLKKKNR